MQILSTNHIRIHRLRKAVLALRALKLPVSQMIIRILSNGDALPVGAIEDLIRSDFQKRITQSNVSQHLSLLRRQRIVIYTKAGQMHFYRINTVRMTQIVNALNNFFYENKTV